MQNKKFLSNKKNREIKDSVFVDLFSTDVTAKENFLSLYNALHGTDLKLEKTDVVLQRLERTLYMGFKNDVSALINGKLLVLIEHQSTVNENMPLRFLEYVAELYKQIVPLEKRYQRKVEKIPAPEFYVLYNGMDDYPSEKTLKLSDAFMEKTDDTATELKNDKSDKKEKNQSIPLEILVKVININTVKCAEILGRCKVLSDYSRFVELMRSEHRSGNRQFIRDAVQTAINHGVLSEYLLRKRWEVDNMTFAEYDYDMDIAVQRREAYEEGLETGEELGMERGEHKKAIETARNFLALGVATHEQIAQATGLSLTEVQQLQISTEADL